MSMADDHPLEAGGANAGPPTGQVRADPEALLSRADALRYLWVDNGGVIRSKAVYLPVVGRDREQLESAVRISQAQFAIPATADVVAFDAGLLPTHDVTLRPDWDTLRALAFTPGHAVVACDIVDGHGVWAHCPRSFLRSVAHKASQHGLDVRVGIELEFVLVEENATPLGMTSPASAALDLAPGRGPSDGSNPNGADVTPWDTAAFAMDSAFDTGHAVIDDIVASLAAQGLGVLQFHPESAPGQWEVSLAAVAPVAAADAVVALRQTIRAVAHRHGAGVSFLPVTFPGAAGSGLHLHLSLTPSDAEDGLGESGEAFIAGILQHLEALLAITAPSALSLQRFQPHAWVGAYTGWGPDNKEVPLRVVTTASGARRDVEFKPADATANPYLAIGAILAAGISGIATNAEAPAPVSTDPGLLTEDARLQAGLVRLPSDARATVDALASDAVLAEAMGAQMLAALVAVRRAEIEAVEGLDFAQRRMLLIDKY